MADAPRQPASGTEASAAEARRLAALARYAILDTMPEDAFDRSVRLAKQIFGVPHALVTFVDAERVWFKARIGVDVQEVPRSHSICTIAILGEGPCVVPDALADPRFASNPLVSRADGLRFYAGAPLVTFDGHALGTICVLDTVPRPGLTDAEARALTDLAASVMSELDLRLRLAEQRKQIARNRLAESILASVAEAVDFDAATRSVMRALRDATGASLCLFWRLASDGRSLQLVGGDGVGPIADPHYLERLRLLHLTVDNAPVGAAIARGEQLVMPDLRAADLDRYPGLKMAVEHGINAQVFAPFSLGDERYGLALGFATGARRDLAAVLESLGDIATTIRPLLRRLRDAQQVRLFRRAVDASNDLVIITDAAQLDEPGPVIEYVNPAVLAQTGYSVIEVLGRTPRLFQGSETSIEARQAIRAALLAGRPVRQEIVNHRKDGAPYWSELSISPVRDADGSPTHFIAIQRDITKQRAEAERSAEREAAFRSLFEGNPIPMWLYDNETFAFLSVNDAAVEAYGWSREEFLRMTILDIRPKEEHEQVVALARSLTEKGAVSGPWRHLTRSGAERTVQIVSRATRFGGRSARFVAVWDLSERLRAESDLRRSEAALADRADELAETQRLARVGRFSYEPTEARIVWSEELLRLFGPAAVPRSTAESGFGLVEPDDREMLHRALEEAAEAVRPFACEFRIDPGTGTPLHIRAEGTPKAEPDGRTHIAGYCQDVTKSRAAELAAARAEKLASIGQLTGGIAHDFNNLLTIIALNLDIAEDRMDEPELRELIAVAREAAQNGAALTHRLLSYARRLPLRPKAIDIVAYMRGFLELVARSVGERHPLRLDLAAGPLVIDVDPAQFEAALLNLVINARDAMPEGGRITISIAPAALEEDAAGDAPKDAVAVTVADNGPGIPSDIVAQVFDPFFTTKPVGKGTGLGLSMVQGFVAQSGGRVTLDTAEGAGTRLSMIFPRLASAGTVAQPAAVRGALPRLRVLVVEDNPEVRRSVERLCGEIGLSPTCLATAEEALHWLGQGHAVDLLLSDVILQDGMDGFKLAASARALRRGLPAILMSGYTEDRLLGGDELPPEILLLNKPFDRAGLVAAVQRALAIAAAPGQAPAEGAAPA
ncbi:PAS domain S-box protein [Elioraea rosea]|uniref:PAS domain S-box protein n=1 Tax=Elioraea rosea TaxID=2492390 RepID=UPI00131539F8|nr:PAS domain S-box protein [Elioraea rosea]